MSKLRKPVTLAEVAEAANVSRATVSRVINGTKFVEPPVADRVRKAIQRLGYVPNHAARSLSTRRTDMVALIASEPDVRFFEDPFFAGIVRGAARQLSEVNMQLLMMLIQTSEDTARIQSYLMGRPVDGVLLISEHATSQIAPPIDAAGIPLVLGGRPMEDSTHHLAHVDNANREGAAMAARHLINRGCRRIGIIAGPGDMTAGIDRLAGFRDAFDGVVDPALITPGDFTLNGGATAMQQLLSNAPDIDGVFAASDLMAVGAMRMLRAAGKSIPGDVAVIGFDDSPVVAEAGVPLTTIHQSPVTQGAMMVRLLLQLLGRTGDLGRSSRESLPGTNSIVLPVRLVQRESA